MIRRLMYLDYSDTKRCSITTMMNGVSRADFMLTPACMESGRRSVEDDELLQSEY